MKITLFAAAALALFAICPNVSGQSQTPAPPPAQKHAAAAKSTTADQDQKEAERRFLANCGRHNPPESISPTEVNAVLRHMRVRAMLSAEDEELIRKYLAP
jgi:hypothetical protein